MFYLNGIQDLPTLATSVYQRETLYLKVSTQWKRVWLTSTGRIVVQERGIFNGRSEWVQTTSLSRKSLQKISESSRLLLK